MRRAGSLVVSLILVGCAAERDGLQPDNKPTRLQPASKRVDRWTRWGEPVRFSLGSMSVEACADVLVARSRAVGYVESTSDRASGFFVVPSRTTLEGRRYTAGAATNVARSRRLNVVHFLVQCSADQVSVSAVGVDGPLDETMTMDRKLRTELDAFGDALKRVDDVGADQPFKAR